MNFKSGILKLSILIMLVLVLLPAIAAEDSSEAFFIEYADEVDEVVVEDSDSIDEMEYVQEDLSQSLEMEEIIIEEEYCENIPIQDQSTEIGDDIILQDEIECSVVETHDIIDEVNEEDEIFNVFCEDVIDNINYNNDIHFDVDCDVTMENTSIIKQGSIIFISEEVNDSTNIILINELFTETANYETHGFKRSLIKALELKNNLLISQDVSFIFADNFIAYVDGDIIICTDKITTDFVFSIDNSVVGDDNLIVFAMTSFCLNFTPSFDTFISCNFLDFKSFFGGDNLIDYHFMR